jgi:hypothetical protein
MGRRRWWRGSRGDGLARDGVTMGGPQEKALPGGGAGRVGWCPVSSFVWLLYTPYTVLTALLRADESPVGRATTLTSNNSALSLGQGLGRALGGLALVLGGWAAVGLRSFTLMLAAAGLVWRSRPPHPVPAAQPAG